LPTYISSLDFEQRLYGMHCDAIGNILGSTLGTWGRSWKCIGNMVGTSESKNSKPVPYTTPFPEWGYPFMYSITEIEAISHTLHQSPKLSWAGVTFWRENCEFLFLTKFRRTNPILEKKIIFKLSYSLRFFKISFKMKQTTSFQENSFSNCMKHIN
jgi:hypothetical protein